jgi:peptide chain release factor 1
MLDKLKLVERHYDELSRLLAREETATDYKRLQELNKERAALEDIVGAYRRYRTLSQQLGELDALLDSDGDAEMTALIKDEVNQIRQQQDELMSGLKLALMPKDPNDDRSVIVEIRAGAGGGEAGLFAADMFRMYSRYAQAKGWEVEVIDGNQSETRGVRELVFEIKGKGAFSRFKHESGVHRVQRVPTTEASGRIHTSTATVAVLPEAEEIELNINPDDLRMEFFHSSGAGGQNVNKVTTAVRITHLPTGVTASCQDDRSQIKNRTKAMAVLRARLLDIEQRKQSESIDKERRMQVGGAQRAEKIRTYNFPQNRVTDHRIGTSFHSLQQVMEGDLDEIIEALTGREQVEQLEAALA